MNLFKKRLTTSTIAVLTSCALSQYSGAQVETFDLTEFQTIDSSGVFPAVNGDNLNSFGADAPFETATYVRSTTNGNAPQRLKLYLQFDLSTLSADEIVSATLEFSAYSLNDRVADNNNPNLFVSQLQDDWAPDGGDPDNPATPIFQPALVESVNGGGVTSGTGTDHFFLGGTPEYRNPTDYSIDILSIVQNYQDGDINNGLILELNDNADGPSSDHAQGIGIDTSSLILRTITGDNPITTLSTASSTVSTDYTVNVNFSEIVAGLEDTDFSVTNGTVSSVTGSGTDYTVLVSPIAGGDVELTLPADSVTGSTSGLGNFVSNTLVTNFELPTPPTVILSTEPGLNDSFTVNVEFDAVVTGLEISDFIITNGTATALEGTANSYTLEVVSSTAGSVEVTLPAGSATDTNNELNNLASNTLVVIFDPTALALTNFANADLNSIVPVIANTGSGALAWSFDPVNNRVLFNGEATSTGANQWVWSTLNGGFAYNPDGGVNGVGDGAFVQTPGTPSQNPRAVLYFVDDNKLTTGLVDFGMDVFFDDNTEANPLQFQVEIYAWDDDQIAPSLSAGGPTPNDPTYNLTDLGEATSILQAQVLASDIADATWQTNALGLMNVGDGFDNYVWRIGVIGATNGDFFGFDNITVTGDPSPPVITSIIREPSGEVDLEFTFSAGNVDIYRSTDLQNFGDTPIAADIEPGSYLDVTAADLLRAFYVLVPAGSPAP